MDYLITGGNGFIGSNLIPHILARDEEATVINLDLARSTLMEERMGIADFHARYAFKEGDICDLSSYEHYLKVSDIIINCASENSRGRFNERFERSIRTNILGARILADAACKNGIPLLHLSTDEVYGSCPTNVQRREESVHMDPTNPYAATMAAGERLVSLTAKMEGVPVAIVRSCEIIGPNQGLSHLVPMTIKSIMEGRPPVVPSLAGEKYRDWLHVLDLCSALEIIIRSLTGTAGPLQAPAQGPELPQPGKTVIHGTSIATVPVDQPTKKRAPPLVGGVTVFNVTSELCEPLTTIVKKLLDFMGSNLPTRAVSDESYKDISYNPSGKKIAYHGWQARYTDIDAVLRSTVDWYREHPERLESTISDRLMP